MKNAREFQNFLKHLLPYILMLFTFGFAFLFAAEHWKNSFSHAIIFLLESLGVLCLSILVMHFIYEVMLRGAFLKLILIVFEKILKQNIPTFLNRVIESGIVDVSDGLNMDELKTVIDNVHDTTIKFLKIWIPELSRLEQALIDAINNRNCKVVIILLDPNSSAIIKRVPMILMYNRIEDVRSQIYLNINVIKSIYERLEPKKRKNLELRIHDSFVAISLIGYGCTYLQGNYIHGRIATSGQILKVESSGVIKKYYRELNEHFKIQYKHSVPYDFDTCSYDVNKICIDELNLN